MKGRTAVLVVVLVVGLGAGVGIRAASSSGPSAKEPPHLITVSGTATVTTPPDEAVVTLGVSSQGTDGSTAFQANATKMKAIMRALQQSGVASADISTTGLNLNQHTKDAGTPQQTTVFTAQNEVQVTIHDLTKVGTAISAAIAAGASNVRNVQFQLSDPTAVSQRALAQAVDGARSKAEAMAKTAGASLGPIVSMRQETGGQPYYRNFAYNALGVAGAGMAAPISPQNIQTQATVTATWQLNG